MVAKSGLPARFSGDRAFSTAIYYLLQGKDFSALHRIKQDEVWHFYDGSPLTIHVIDREGNYSTVRVGRSSGAGELPQAVVMAGCLFGATVDVPHSFALAGCTVAPGFDFADFLRAARPRGAVPAVSPAPAGHREADASNGIFANRQWVARQVR